MDIIILDARITLFVKKLFSTIIFYLLNNFSDFSSKNPISFKVKYKTKDSILYLFKCTEMPSLNKTVFR